MTQLEVRIIQVGPELKLEDILNRCRIELQAKDEEQQLVKEFEALRNDYLKEVDKVRDKYQDRFDAILYKLQEIRRKDAQQL